LFALTVLIAVCAVIAYIDTTIPTLSEVSIPVSGLDHRMTILQVTDLHSARFGTDQQQITRLLGQRRFDAVVMCGDMQNAPTADMQPALELLDELQKRTTGTVVFVPGNHDGDAISEAFRAAGALQLGRDGATYALPAGQDTVLFEAAGMNASPDASTTAIDVIVSHAPLAPSQIGSQQPGEPTRLYLAGHTHGGQIRLPFIGALLSPRPTSTSAAFLPDLQGLFVCGLYEHNDAYINVSPGLGTYRIPVRFCDQARFDIIDLVPAR